MLVEEIYGLLREYTDDSDTTFMNSTKYVTALKLAYNEFRLMVYKMAPEIYETFITANIAGVNYYGLNTVILGATVTSTRASRITRVSSYDSTTGKDKYYYTPVASLEQLYATSNWQPSWILQGTVLTFALNITDTIKIYYLPADTTNWTAGIVTGSSVFLDDLGEYHDLIALMAAKQYSIKDYAINPVLEQQLSIRKKEFANYLTMGRNGDAYRFVQTEEQGW